MVVENLANNVPLTLLIGLVSILLLFFVWRRRPSGLPPFPTVPLPIVGNLLSLNQDSRAQFLKWRAKHGDIFSLYMGRTLMIVLNGHECIKEALVKNANIFSDRPDLFLINTLFRNHGIGPTSGPLWKSQRTFTLKALRGFGFGRASMEAEMREEVKHMLTFFACTKGEKHMFDQIFNMATSNILCSMVFGHRFDYDDKHFQDCCTSLETLAKNISNVSLINFLPFLRYLPGQVGQLKCSVKAIDYVHDTLITPEIQKHYTDFNGQAGDFISAYIKEIEEKEALGQDTRDLKDNFTQTLTDLFMAGTETTATTLKRLMLFLVRYPEVQEKCFQEIKSNIGLERLPELQDKSALTYIQATFAETQRRADIIPFGVLHAAAGDTQFRGFNIPKGSAVMTNLNSVHMDPKIWPNPEEFRPERFLDKKRVFFKPEAFMPFSIGRRVCLGESLAKMKMFLLGSALIQKFHFRQPEGEQLPSLESVVMTVARPLPYKIRAIPRSQCI